MAHIQANIHNCPTKHNFRQQSQEFIFPRQFFFKSAPSLQCSGFPQAAKTRNTLSINILTFHTVPGLIPHRQTWNVRESKLGYSQKQDLKAAPLGNGNKEMIGEQFPRHSREAQIADSKQLPIIRCPENGAANSRKQLIYSRLHTTHFWAAGFRLRPS